MGVEFDGSFNGLPLVASYARIDQFSVTLPLALGDVPTLAPAVAKVYASMAGFSAGAAPINVLPCPIEAPLTFPATEVSMRADLDPGLLLVLQNTPGLVVTASAFVLDPAPP